MINDVDFLNGGTGGVCLALHVTAYRVAVEVLLQEPRLLAEFLARLEVETGVVVNRQQTLIDDDF